MQVRKEREERRPAILRKKTSHQSPPSGSGGSGNLGDGAGAGFSARFLFLAPLTGAMDAEGDQGKRPEDSKTGGAEMQAGSPTLGVRPPAASMARLSKLYLLCYNSLQSLGWFIALLRLLPCLAPPLSIHSAYAVAGELICTSSTLPDPPTHARPHIPVQSSPSVFITFIAWSISEVIRYSHYALTILKFSPAWLTYIRTLNHASVESCTLLLSHCIQSGSDQEKVSSNALTHSMAAPSAVTLSLIIAFFAVWTIYQALPFVKERKLYSGFFEKFSMSYHSFLVGGLLCYPFLWLKLYLHVFKQRRSKLGKMDRNKRA
ncbi:hypothetical protein PR202_gb01468 [Eleusine coracana subsp. coracana]|uniref:Very-long-chain (3R)-3-hydroxyacyl-CoA dehydratase n=1 Tax=Eleusine coracana subsp. coracana TaxID=191504 RepID=A0AAV5DWM3_ELECO|nr:hypothetical protein PR202_gb01468 [Eleusine coracana subsp. coracana]